MPSLTPSQQEDAHGAFIARVQKLEPFIIGLYPSAQTIEGRAEYISALTKIVAEHVEAMAAEVDANQSYVSIYEEEARGIADIGSDLASRITRAADLMMEMV